MGRRLLLATVGVALVAAFSGDVGADDGRDCPPGQQPVEPTAAQRDAAIARGVAFLDEKLWTLQDAGSPQKQYAAAVAGWAYLLMGTKPPQGVPPRARAIERIEDYLAQYEERVADVYAPPASRKPRPDPSPIGSPRELGGVLGSLEVTQFVWPLSQDAEFRAESLARGRRAKETKEALGRVVRVLEASQQDDGGWGHDDARRPGVVSLVDSLHVPIQGRGALKYPDTLCAGSHCALAGVAAAHRALGTKDAKAVGRGRAYFAAVQNPDGTFEYDASQKVAEGTDHSGLPDVERCTEIARTAGAAFALLQAGASAADPTLAKALKAVEGRTEILSEGHGSATLALEYAALLRRAQGPESWAEFRRVFFPRILAAQAADGSFDCACKRVHGAVSCDTQERPSDAKDGGDWALGARVRVTAVHVLILAMDRDAPKVLPSVAAAPAVTPK